MMWAVFGFLSALFAALTSILYLSQNRDFWRQF